LRGRSGALRRSSALKAAGGGGDILHFEGHFAVFPPDKLSDDAEYRGRNEGGDADYGHGSPPAGESGGGMAFGEGHRAESDGSAAAESGGDDDYGTKEEGGKRARDGEDDAGDYEG